LLLSAIKHKADKKTFQSADFCSVFVRVLARALPIEIFAVEYKSIVTCAIANKQD
jgi:hypothetical protein